MLSRRFIDLSLLAVIGLVLLVSPFGYSQPAKASEIYEMSFEPIRELETLNDAVDEELLINLTNEANALLDSLNQEFSPETITNTVSTPEITVEEVVYEEPVKTITVNYGDYIGLTPDAIESAARDLGLSPTYASSKDSYSSSIPAGNVVWHGSGDYVENETFRYGLSLGPRPHDSVHYVTAVIVPRSTDVSEEQALIDAGNVVATEGTYAGSFNMFAHNFNQGNGWKASFEVGDYVIINNTYKFQIYDIGNGYQDDDGYLWYQGRKAINPDLMADLVVNTCNKGNSRWFALGRAVD